MLHCITVTINSTCTQLPASNEAPFPISFPPSAPSPDAWDLHLSGDHSGQLSFPVILSQGREQGTRVRPAGLTHTLTPHLRDSVAVITMSPPSPCPVQSCPQGGEEEPKECLFPHRLRVTFSTQMHIQATLMRWEGTRCASLVMSRPSKTYRLFRPTASRSGDEKRFGNPFRALGLFLPSKDILFKIFL